MPRLELLGAEVAERGVDPHPVAEALDVLEDLERRPLSALEGARVRALGLDEPMSDSIAALSHGLAIEPIDGLMPTSRIVLPIRSETCWLPWMPF